VFIASSSNEMDIYIHDHLEIHVESFREDGFLK